MSNVERPAYRVIIASSRVERELDSLSASDHGRVISALRNLENDPRPRISISLQNSIYRLRIGRLRVIYLIEESNRTIVVGAIRRRSETTYRDIQRLF